MRIRIRVRPVGTGGTGGTAASKRVAIALPVAATELGGLIEIATLWRSRLSLIHPKLPDELSALPNTPELISYHYRDVICDAYHHQAVVLIGDAAHAMSPQLGMGASLGLLDAWELVNCLADHALPQALVRFQLLRQPEATRLRRISQLVTPFFQSSSRLVNALREPAMVGLGKLTPLKRLALNTLCRIPKSLRSF